MYLPNATHESLTMRRSLYFLHQCLSLVFADFAIEQTLPHAQDLWLFMIYSSGFMMNLCLAGCQAKLTLNLFMLTWGESNIPCFSCEPVLYLVKYSLSKCFFLYVLWKMWGTWLGIIWCENLGLQVEKLPQHCCGTEIVNNKLSNLNSPSCYLMP